MALKAQVLELRCLEPENYRLFFRALCWSTTRKYDKKGSKKVGKKEKLRRQKAASGAPMCHAPALIGNPSHFAVFATVRRAVLARWRHLQAATADLSDDSDNDESTTQIPLSKLPKVTGIGLRTVFALISQARLTEPLFCEHALRALLDVLQGHAPEELAQEPSEIISALVSMLVEVSSGGGPGGRMEAPSALTALGCAALLALAVARGEAELVLAAVADLIMAAPVLADQYIQVPSNLTTLQRSVQSVILGKPSRNQWLHFGVPHPALVSSFPVDLPPLITAGAGELVVRSLASDGCYLYVFTSKGLLKIGSGYGSSIRQHVYVYKPDFFPTERHGWLGYCKNKLYVRIGRKKTEVYEVDVETLEIKGMLRLEAAAAHAHVDHKSAVFSDGNELGLILHSSYDTMLVRMFDVESPRAEGSPTPMTDYKEISVHLLRRHVLIFGRSPFEDGFSRRSVEADAQLAVQMEDDEDDPLMGICSGQDFCLLNTITGRVYYTGKGASLGYKTASPVTNRWTLMKETVFTRNDMANLKKGRVMQVAVGHEGVHAILVMDNGVALFAGVARRGEDGDVSKHRRTPKPTRPKKIVKAEGHHIIFAACNYGSTALVTKQGLLLMFGKDTQHCDPAGVVTGLRHERVSSVALGKAHAVVLTHLGLVYTFGINNKGQCGREFGYTKEKSFARRHSANKEDSRLCARHTWSSEYCRVCVVCRECTGFSSACHLAQLPNRTPGERCGCGEGDSGCSTCGVCRRCADAFSACRPEHTTDLDDDTAPAAPDPRTDKENARYQHFETAASSEAEREWSVCVSCLPPARVAVPGAHRVSAIAAGLHHTVLLTEHGEVLTFGSNQYGQLGAGDISAHHKIVRVRLPRCVSIACGSNHTVALTRDGEVFTFGSYQKGALGRPRVDEPARTERSPIWHATPGRVPRMGPRHTTKGVVILASGDQTFVQVSQSVIKPDFLFSSTIMANSNSIVILPNRPEHTFKCITVNRNDASCQSWTGPEQVDFVNTLACLDPLYDVMWCYQPQMRVMKCYNILTYDSSKSQRCCANNMDPYSADADYEYPNYGTMKRLEDFKNLETFDLKSVNEDRVADNVALSNVSVLNQELAIPSAPGHSVTRMHAALHLLGCLDSLTYAHDTKLNQPESKREHNSSPVAPIKEDFQTVSRFESHGGGWGYSGHSVEAIRFMCDTDISLGGFGLFGGRGDYTAKIKLFDIGPDGGDQEGDGELLAESEEVMFECAPRDRFPVLLPQPVNIAANRWYVAWACINGPSSDCGSSGQAMVINDDVGFHFKTSKKSNNGTDVNAGQIPCLLYNTLGPDHAVTVRCLDYGDPVIPLTKNLSRKVTVQCFKSLITLLQWSWKTFKETLLETNGQVPITYQKLTVMKHQKRLVYVIRASLRLVKSYIIEIYPQQNKKRNSRDYMSYFEAIGEVRNFIQGMMGELTPTCAMLPRKPGRSKHRVCYVQFALEMTSAVLAEAHDTITTCFHAFFPTPTLKWTHLCSLLHYVSEGAVPAQFVRELTAVCAALCAARSLRDVLHYVVPVTQSQLARETRPTEVVPEVPSKSATVPRSAHQKPPPVPPRASHRDDHRESKCNYTEWHLLDVIPRLLDIVLMPIKEQMMTRQCGQPHEHGEAALQQRLADCCCKLVTRVVAELAVQATDVKEDQDTHTVKHLVTPSRFMRVNQTRVWNTGNGSPDAVCFTVDRPGVVLVGACVYSGLGPYEYELELLQDLTLRATAEESDPGHCWVSVEVAHGSFKSSDCQHDIVHVKFDRPVPLKEEVRYAVRLCNQGGRTSSGDCGLPAVKGPDGTTFRFSSCSLSFNGTTMARGQIPSLIYYGTSKSRSLESPDALISALRSVTLVVAGAVADRGGALLAALRGELTAEDLRRNAAVLQRSPAINTLLPYTLASLDALDDSKSVIKILELVHKLLPHVAAMNLLLPSAEELGTTTTHYYTWVESDHPYKPAAVANMRVLFPTSVSWVVLEMDPRSLTAQPEDSLTVFAAGGAPGGRCAHHDLRLLRPPFSKRLVQASSESGELEEVVDEGESEIPCTHYNCAYYSVTPKLANVPADWPQKALVVPGNEVIFSLETASDYLNEYNKTDNEDSHFGFRCLCVGYEDAPLTAQRQGLLALEMELVYAGAGCAARLLSPDLDMPPLSFATIVEVQLLAMMGSSPVGGEAEGQQDSSEALMLSRGLEITSPPTIHQVLDGQPLLRCITTERQFLSDFVCGAESTAGGRLAHWLSPASRVEPSRCEMRAPSAPPRPALRATLPILIRDQYGEPVASPSLKVEVVVQRLEEGNARHSRSSDSRRGSLPDAAYQPAVRDTMCFQAITVQKAYQNYSFEELRYLSGQWGAACGGPLAASGRVPTERLPVRAQPDGSYVASWTPRAAGLYLFRCTLDDQPAPQELTVEVQESTLEGPAECVAPPATAVPPPPAPKLLRFAARHSAGLRVRASPSLQAEELGRVPPGASVAFIEEVVNKDGTWVRLTSQSARSFTDSETAWCLQHHRHTDRVLLTSEMTEDSDPWTGYDAHSDMPTWNEDELDVGTSEITCLDDRRFPFTVLSELSNEISTGDIYRGMLKLLESLPLMRKIVLYQEQCERATSPFVFGSGAERFAEPSKRDRMLRNETCSSPRRLQRRSNGNSEEWWSPVYQRPDNPRDVDTIPETEIEPEPPESVEQHEAEAGRRPGLEAGTQTSPEPAPHVCLPAKDGRLSPKSLARSRIAHRSLPYRRAASPPPLPARTAPAPPPPRKHALSPAQAECLRAIFAALLWHEGIVHDAIACAAFLKFHPQLPKQGARVVTRGSHDLAAPRLQRHSVEVTNAGQYLRINEATLESLTRCGAEASASRDRTQDVAGTICEEDSPQPGFSGSSPSVVNVLPPALRALVALWDAMYDADQLTAATDKLKKEEAEKNENDESRAFSGIRKKREWKGVYKTPYSVHCELCAGNVPPPLAAHMRHAHAGCRAPAAHGYDRSGAYKRADNADAAACGQLAQAYQLWYIFCEKCRDKALKATSSVKQSKTKSVGEGGAERGDPPPDVDHHTMKDNAVFLLDLSPINYSESVSSSPWHEGPGRSPPTPPGSVWQPAPPFQSLQALGAAPRPQAEAARYHSLGRPPTAAAASPAPFAASSSSGSTLPRVHRSVSMGQESGRDLAQAGRQPLTARPPDRQDSLAGGGSSLLAQPSAALQRLVGCGAWGAEVSAFEPSRVDPEALLKSPVMNFVLARRDLHAYRQKMDAAVRINTVRQYAFEALNWLLRSATQPTCVHDVMWWFCTALDKYARIISPTHDNKENIPSKPSAPATASASAICPGGRSARGARAAFHAFLGSVSALAPALPPASAAGLQAVRCWALHYSPHDRAFLHRSQVFSVISRILSHAEDSYDDAALALHDSFHSFHSKESYAWVCPDVTGWCDVSVSSRQGMAGALTDGSTETFWESGDEDRNKAKWIQVSYPGGTVEDRPHVVCVHIDNTRDTVNKTLLISFLYAGGSSEMFHMQDVEVDPKAATWLCYTLPRVTSPSVRVRCELRGPEPAVRVRQIRVLAAPAPAPPAPSGPAHVLHRLSETDTLRVFRLLTSQVFGKLLEWEQRNGSESGAEASGAEEPVADDSDLREHVVGILFAGHKLTSLQRQVMSHIVLAIGCEAGRVRDDWETALLCAEAERASERTSERASEPLLHTQDNYCFEMLSLLLALSGSAVGRAHLAQQTELLADLLALLHTGSERVQRQVISLLRRIISEIPPQRMFAAINYKNDPNTRVTVLDHLVAYLGKAITIQVKLKGLSQSGQQSATMASSIASSLPNTWFMRGETTKKHAQLVAKLLSDMAEDKLSRGWGPETRAALANYVAQVAQISEASRHPSRCLASPEMWLALAALCVCEQSYVDVVNGTVDGRDSRRDVPEVRPFCSNHDDGATIAVVECRTCGPLCAECDRFLHLNRAARTHQRQVCKEEESAIRIDIHEGCGRAKLFWLLLLVDRRTLKGLAEFRGLDAGIDPLEGAASGGGGMAGTCRFCGTRGTTGLLAIGNVCADQQCQEHGREACNRVLRCGHACGGVRCEPACLPCLFGCAGRDMRQDADDMCMICFTDPLQAAPSIQLKCGHVFHLHCCKKVLANKWIGPRITFSFAQCPICKEDMDHWTLEDLLAPIKRLYEEVKRKALMRLEYEGVAAPASAAKRPPPDLALYAMERYAYYVCHKCEKAYFGGLARCEAETSGHWEPAELVCGGCSDVAGARTCPKHGADFLEYKCRYCCSVAVFFCFGTSHFCNACHDDFQRVTNIPKNMLPQCPAGPKGEQLPGSADECPLHIQHPPTGEEFALGCGVCRHTQGF